MIAKIITYSFYLLFAVTPLIWFPWSFELFEYNKMMFVYLLTIVITFFWLLKMIQTKSLIIKRTPLDIPILLFLLANILSTFFSIDTHTSIWGYYSRSNGGLLSTISYILLYYALVSNFDLKGVLNFLKAAVFGGVAVSLWAIPEHFGISLSCILLTGQPNAACWVQDVAARVFATLGQPNWLAAYLAMLIFPALYFAINAKEKLPLILNALFLILFYLAFTFTYSRGATIGLWVGLATFAAFQLLTLRRNLTPAKPLAIMLAFFVVINILFGSALTNFKLLSQFAGPARPSVAISKPVTNSTQLESGGTESGTIRLIVWRGAVDIFKHYPIFGSGVETFAYSYYQFRPVEHNSVSEWDFLYNKAHNEFLNYLATTGLVGFLSYMAVILTFIFWSIKQAIHYLTTSKKENHLPLLTLTSALFASYISYLVQNFFGFSVVNVALFFFLFPAIAFVTTGSVKPVRSLSFFTFIYSRPLYINLVRGGLFLAFGLLTFTLLRYYLADTYFALGNRAGDAGNPGKAYNNLVIAVNLNPDEPYYRSELGYAAAAAASALADADSTTSGQLKKRAIEETARVLVSSPKNVSFLRTQVRTFYYLSTIDKNYTEKTLNALDQAIALAPTDPKLTYNKAIILGQVDKNEEAIAVLEKTVALRPSYRDAVYGLGLFYKEAGQEEKAIEQMNKVLKLIPGDPDASEKLSKWQ